MMTSPSCTRCGPGSSSASTTPVAAPATSYSSTPRRPGCSAVSPPTSAVPAASQAAAMPHDAGDALGDHLAGGDVVGHEQGLGAHHHDVVDHAHEVPPDGVVDVQGLGDGHLGAHSVRGRGQVRLAVGGELRDVEETCEPAHAAHHAGRVGGLHNGAFMSSTARSPASTSTPALAWPRRDGLGVVGLLAHARVSGWRRRRIGR